MFTLFTVYDDQNNRQATFTGPCRLAQWDSLPDGWTIEEFQGTVSRGVISLDEVKTMARKVKAERELEKEIERFERCGACRFDGVYYRRIPYGPDDQPALERTINGDREIIVGFRSVPFRSWDAVDSYAISDMRRRFQENSPQAVTN